MRTYYNEIYFFKWKYNLSQSAIISHPLTVTVLVYKPGLLPTRLPILLTLLLVHSH